jgi:molybdate transport system regulatory protein
LFIFQTVSNISEIVARKSASPKPRKSAARLRITARVMAGERIAFGPGKAELLQHVVETGSLRAAAAKMEMSYMRAWHLLQDMNACFREPLVLTERGGSAHGGSVVTPAGRKVLQEYTAMSAAVQQAAQTGWQKISRELKAG